MSRLLGLGRASWAAPVLVGVVSGVCANKTVATERQAGRGKDKAAATQAHGPMVAVFLDDESVKTLRAMHPKTREAKLRRVVIQYNPTDEERAVYQPLYGGSAKVEVSGLVWTGGGRRALVAEVRLGGGRVDAQSLAPAIDVSEGDSGRGGLLGSAALVEQARRAGAFSKAAWQGQLGALECHGEAFVSSTGHYRRLERPVSLRGSVCRADWVDGASSRCLPPPGGEGRGGGGSEPLWPWEPSGCQLCNEMRSSPCARIFERWHTLEEEVAKSGGANNPSDGAAAGRPTAAAAKGPGPAAKAKDGPEGHGGASGTGGGDSGSVGGQLEEGEKEAEKEKGAEAPVATIDTLIATAREMRECIEYHDVFGGAIAAAAAAENGEE